MAEQPAVLVTVTVYVVVLVGLATGLLIIGLFNPEVGAQLKFSPPDAVHVVELPLQTHNLAFGKSVVSVDVNVVFELLFVGGVENVTGGKLVAQLQ